MPISQSRMIAIINAADDALTKLLHLRKTLASAINADDANAAINAIAADLAMYIPEPEHIQCISSERAHFKRMLHKNNRDAARQRLRRGVPDPGDYAYTGSIRTTPARAAGAHAAAHNARQRTIDSAPNVPSQADIAAQFARLYDPAEFDRAASRLAPSTPTAPISPPAPRDAPALESLTDDHFPPGGTDEDDEEPNPQ